MRDDAISITAADRAYSRALKQARAKLARLLDEAEGWAVGRRVAADARREEAYVTIADELQRDTDRVHRQFDAHMAKLNADRQAARDQARARAAAAGPLSTLPPLPSSLTPELAFLPADIQGGGMTVPA